MQTKITWYFDVKIAQPQNTRFAQDDMVNALGSGKVEVGDEAWYKYHDRVNELAEQRDAYNMGKMGQLDGEKAVTASDERYC